MTGIRKKSTFGLFGALAIVVLTLVPGPVVPAPPGVAAAQPGYYVAAWGSGAAGPLGTTACCDFRSNPMGVPGTNKLLAVAAVNGGAVAVAPDHTVWAWGLYLPRPYIPALLPKQIPGLANVIALAAGSQFVLALTSDGTVWSWGIGALGRSVSTVAPAGTPTPIPGLSHVAQISAGGNNGLAITADGSLYSWGDNWTGQIGDGTRSQRPTPVLIPVLSHVISAATSGQNAVAVESTGTVWAWGDTATGAPRRPGIIQSPVPMRVKGTPAASQVMAGFSTGLALTRDGTVWAWGENGSDALHTGHPSQGFNGSAPAQVIGLDNVTSIASGANRYMAIKRDGSVWTWAGGSGGPARQPGLEGAAAIAASPTQWLALVSTPPPTPPTPALSACRRIVKGRLIVSFYPSSLLVDQRTGRAFVLDGGSYRSAHANSRVCTASLSMLDGRTGRVLRTVLLGKGTESFARSPMNARNPLWLSQEGGRIVVAYQPSQTSQDTAGGISIVDAGTGKLVRSVTAGYIVYGLAADKATHRVFVSYTQDRGAHYETSTDASLAIIDVGGSVRSEVVPITATPVVDPNAGRLFMLGDTGSVAIDTRTGTIIRKVTYRGGALAGFGLAEHAGRLFVAYGMSPHCCGPSLQLLDSHSGKHIAELGADGQYGPVVLDAPVGRVLVSKYGFSTPIQGVTEVRESRTGHLLRRLPYLIGPSVVDSRNGRLYTITAPNTVTVLEPRGWRIVGRYHPGATLVAIALDQRTNRIFVLSQSGQGVDATQTVHVFCVASRCR